MDTLSKLSDIVSMLPSIEQVVVTRFTAPASIKLNISNIKNGVHYDDFVAPFASTCKQPACPLQATTGPLMLPFTMGAHRWQGLDRVRAGAL